MRWIVCIAVLMALYTWHQQTQRCLTKSAGYSTSPTYKIWSGGHEFVRCPYADNNQDWAYRCAKCSKMHYEPK